MFTIAVDFDNTLIERDENGVFFPIPGAAEAMQRLRKKGCRIVIYTCRTGIAAKNRSLMEEISFIENKLTEHNIVFDDIFLGEKMVADFYIDDRAIPYRGSWQETLNDTERNIDLLEHADDPEDVAI